MTYYRHWLPVIWWPALTSDWHGCPQSRSWSYCHDLFHLLTYYPPIWLTLLFCSDPSSHDLLYALTSCCSMTCADKWLTWQSPPYRLSMSWSYCHDLFHLLTSCPPMTCSNCTDLSSHELLSALTSCRLMTCVDKWLTWLSPAMLAVQVMVMRRLQGVGAGGR